MKYGRILSPLSIFQTVCGNPWKLNVFTFLKLQYIIYINMEMVSMLVSVSWYFCVSDNCKKMFCRDFLVCFCYFFKIDHTVPKLTLIADLRSVVSVWHNQKYWWIIYYIMPQIWLSVILQCVICPTWIQTKSWEWTVLNCHSKRTRPACFIKAPEWQCQQEQSEAFPNGFNFARTVNEHGHIYIYTHMYSACGITVIESPLA